MGVKIFDLIEAQQIQLKELHGKTIAIDGNLVLYQFLSSIRQRDGSFLTDSHGNVTSHLSGLFSRCTRLMQYGIRLCFVFDGKSPELKQQEQKRRRHLKEEAIVKYKEARLHEDIAEMRKYAARTSSLTKEMITEAREMLAALGVPVIQAPSEGEAQAAQIVKNGDAYAVASQDADCFLFGAPRVIRNLAISPKRKQPGAMAYHEIAPEIIHQDKLLNTLGVTQDQLIALSILVGTDFNVGGVKGIGPHKALKLVKLHGSDFNGLFSSVNWDKPVGWKQIFDAIRSMPVDNNYRLAWKSIDEKSVCDILCDKHDFSAERVQSQLAKLIHERKSRQQTTLGDF